MEDSRAGEPSPNQATDSFPAPSTPFLASSAKDVSPKALNLRIECVQAFGVSGDRVVVEPTANHGTKPPAHVPYRLMHAAS